MRGLETASLAEPPPRFGTPIAGAEAGLILASGAYSKSLIKPALAADRSEHSIRGTVSRHKQQATTIGFHDASASLRTARGLSAEYQSMSGKTSIVGFRSAAAIRTRTLMLPERCPLSIRDT